MGQQHRARLALTPGEPAGIGPELCVRLAQTGHASELVVVADPELLRQSAATLGLPLTLIEHEPSTAPAPQRAGTLHIHPVPLAGPVRPGHLDTANAAYNPPKTPRALVSV